MRILICNAKSWFDLSEKDFNDHDVKTIKKEGDLSEAFVKEFDPDYIFFVHWHWKVSEAIHVKYTCILSMSPRSLLEEVVHQFKI